MQPIRYIDCFASIGKWTSKDIEAPWTIEKMLSDMERCRIHGALVYSNLAKELQPSVGNRLIWDICHQNPRFIPCWIALPHYCHEAAEGSKFVQEMIDRGVRAVKLYPKTHRYPLNDQAIGSLLSALQEADMPMIIDRGEHEPDSQQIDWQEIAPLCNRYPELKIVLHGVRWEATRYLLPLLKQFPNLYFEFSNYQGFQIIEFLIDEIGSNQLLFGTEMMAKSPGAARAFIDYAEIGDTDRKKIAGQNLIQLLKLEHIPPDYPDDDAKDRILQKVRLAEPIDDMEVIDAHAHINEQGHFDNVIAVMPNSDADGVIRRNRRIGVDITCVSSWTGIWNDYERGNEITHHAMVEFPQNLIGYATLDPNYVKDWNTELSRCYNLYGMRGMKPYFPRNKVPYNDPVYKSWFDYSNQYRLFALMHFSDNFNKEMEQLAEKYPQIAFLLAHSGMSYETARKHIELTKKYSNIFLEITYTAVTNGIIEYMVREIGSQRIIYGSDTPMRDPIPQFGWLTYANITEIEKRNILGRNMRKIIDRASFSFM